MMLQSNFKRWISDYCQWRQSLGFSKDHEMHLTKFDTYCYQFHSSEHAVTKDLVCGWLSYEIKCGRRCIGNKSAAIRSFANYVENGSYVLNKRFAFYKRNFNPYILTDEELARLFVAIDKVNKPDDPFWAETAGTIFRLQYTCGLRPQEVRKIHCQDIDFQTGEIFISQSKLNKDRIVVATQDIMSLLHAYRIRRNYFCKDNNEFFIHTDGRHITSEQLTDLLQKCWKEANPDVSNDILPPLRPYDLRHRFASAVLQRWIDAEKSPYVMLPYLRAYMGHEDIRDTIYYIHILPENLLSSKGVNWKQIESVSLEEEIWHH